MKKRNVIEVIAEKVTFLTSKKEEVAEVKKTRKRKQQQ